MEFTENEMIAMHESAERIASEEAYFVTWMPRDAANLFDIMALSDHDWYDREATTMETLFSMCEVLRAYESPLWGNTGGRYGHGGGYLTGEVFDALDSGADDLELQDTSMGYAMLALARHLRDEGESGLRAAIMLGDILGMALDMMPVD